MQPILIRSLRRSFVISSQWAGTQLSGLQTMPDMPWPEPTPEEIGFAAVGPHFEMTLPSGLVLQGSVRECIYQLDTRILREAIGAESDALAFRAAVMRCPNGERVALLGGRQAGKTWVALALVAAGWHFEGDSWAIIRLEGCVVVPRTIRLDHASLNHASLKLPPYIQRFADDAPVLPNGATKNAFVIDPQRFGERWTLQDGALSALIFLERLPGSVGRLATLDRDMAFRWALSLNARKMTGRGASALRFLIAKAPTFRLQIDSAERAAERIVEAYARMWRVAQPFHQSADRS